MKILITGYKGFIGQNMVKALKEHDLTLFEWGDPLPVVDIFDWVIHLGAISSTTEKDVEKIMKQNYDFSKWLLNECNEAGVNFQYSSSASVYGLNQDFREDAPKNPLNPYAWSKYFFDKYVEENEWKNIRVQGFRYFNVYGPHEDHKGTQASPYQQFAIQARETGIIKVFEGSASYTRDFVPVSSVIDAHLKFFNVPESGIWNVGTGTSRSFMSVAIEVMTKIGANIKTIKMPESLKNQYQTYTCADMTKYNNTLRRYNITP